MERVIEWEGNHYSVKISSLGGKGEIEINGKKFFYDWVPLANGGGSLLIGNRSFRIDASTRKDDLFLLWVGSRGVAVRILDPRVLKAQQMSVQVGSLVKSIKVKAPMPGLVVKVLVNVGEEVKKGQGLVIVEAMKMENVIPSPIEGEVIELCAQVGQAVEKGEILMVVGGKKRD